MNAVAPAPHNQQKDRELLSLARRRLSAFLGELFEAGKLLYGQLRLSPRAHLDGRVGRISTGPLLGDQCIVSDLALGDAQDAPRLPGLPGLCPRTRHLSAFRQRILSNTIQVPHDRKSFFQRSLQAIVPPGEKKGFNDSSPYPAHQKDKRDNCPPKGLAWRRHSCVY